MGFGRITAAVAGAAAGLILAVSLAELPGLIARCRESASLVSDADGELADICIHYRPEFHEQCIETYSDLFSALGPEVIVRVAVEVRGHYDMFMTALARMQLRSLPRLRPVVTGFEITPWAKDRFGTMLSGGRAVLAIPPTVGMVPGARANDFRVPGVMAASVPGASARALAFHFEGGDLLADRENVYVTATLLARNQPYDVDGREHLLRLISHTFKKKVVLIGDRPRDVPDHHIGMYLTLLGDGMVAVADPDLGHRMWQQMRPRPTDVEVETDTAKYEPFRYVIRTMEENGLDVIRVPMLLTTAPGVYVTYNNAIVETRGDGRRIYLPVYGIPALDDAATRLYESIGIEVVPVRVKKIYKHTGSLRCLVGIIRRT